MKKSILFFVKTFNMDNQKWLTDELIYGFSQTHKCTVFCIDRKNKWSTGMYKVNDSIDLIVFSLTNKHNKVKTLIELIYHARVFFFSQIKNKKFDILIQFSIFSYFLGFSRQLKQKNKINQSFGILWDFFPIHQVQTGHINKYIANILYLFEKQEILNNDIIFLMSEKNVSFFKNYYPQNNHNTEILHIWSDSKKNITKSEPYNLDKNKLNIVFGGQLEKGRGIESIIKTIINNSQLNDKVSLYILGDGRLKQTIMQQIKDINNIHLLDPLTRDKYLGFLSAVDIGLISTVPNVTIPSFPSKILDYLYMSKIVIASTESSSDFGDYVENKIACGYATIADDSESFINALEKVYELKYNNHKQFVQLGDNGHTFFQKFMTTEVAVKKIENCFKVNIEL